jgi:hypothetical protein
MAPTKGIKRTTSQNPDPKKKTFKANHPFLKWFGVIIRGLQFNSKLVYKKKKN